MRRFVFAVAIGMVGCRAVLGIEDQELSDGGSADGGIDARADASSDTGAGDTGIADNAAPPDTSQPFPDASATIAACVAQGSMCLGCCRQNLAPEERVLETYAIQDQCICGTGACTGDDSQQGCGQKACAMPRLDPAPPCGQCEDKAFTSQTQACKTAGEDCRADPTCAAAIECIRACPPP